MIPEDKLYHGSVLAGIVDAYNSPITIRSYTEEGRLLNYIINDKVALQVKYATQRLRPWHFTFSSEHIRILERLVSDYSACFVVLVCRTDGTISIPAKDVLESLSEANPAKA